MADAAVAAHIGQLCFCLRQTGLRLLHGGLLLRRFELHQQLPSLYGIAFADFHAVHTADDGAAHTYARAGFHPCRKLQGTHQWLGLNPHGRHHRSTPLLNSGIGNHGHDGCGYAPPQALAARMFRCWLLVAWFGVQKHLPGAGRSMAQAAEAPASGQCFYSLNSEPADCGTTSPRC